MKTKLIILALILALPNVGSAAGKPPYGERPAVDQPADNDFDDPFFAQAEVDAPPPDDAPPPMFGGGRWRPGFDGPPRQFERFRKKKMVEFLKLNDDQEEKFLEMVDSQRDRRFEWMREYMAAIDSLSAGLRSGDLPDSEIDRFARKIDELDGIKLEMTRTFHDEARSILSAEQFGKMLVFEIRFESQVLGKINEFRNRRGDFPPKGRRGPRDFDQPEENDSI